MAELRTPVCYLPDGTLSTRPCGLTYKNSGTSITPYSNLLGSWIHIIWRTSSSCKGYCSIWIYLIPEFSIRRNLFENLSEFIQFLSSDNESSNKEEALYFIRKWRKPWSTPFLFVCMFLILPQPSLRSHMNEMSLFAQ